MIEIFMSGSHLFKSGLGGNGRRGSRLWADKFEKDFQVAVLLWICFAAFALGFAPIGQRETS